MCPRRDRWGCSTASPATTICGIQTALGQPMCTVEIKRPPRSNTQPPPALMKASAWRCGCASADSAPAARTRREIDWFSGSFIKNIGPEVFCDTPGPMSFICYFRGQSYCFRGDSNNSGLLQHGGDLRSEVLLHALEDKGIYVSSGSACSSNHPSVSSTLKSIGVKKELLDSTIRFSIGMETTMEEITYTIDTLRTLLPMLRRYRRT